MAPPGAPAPAPGGPPCGCPSRARGVRGVLGPGAPPRGRFGPPSRPSPSPRRASARRLSASPLRSLWVAPVASGYRRPACARRPAPARPPPPPAFGRSAPRAGGACWGGPRPLRGRVAGAWGRPWPASGFLRSPCAALRALPCAPAPGRVPLRLRPLRSPCGALRGPPFGRPGSSRPAGLAAPAGPLFPPRPAGRWGATVQPARQGFNRAAKGRPCPSVRPAAWVGEPPKRGLDKLERLC